MTRRERVWRAVRHARETDFIPYQVDFTPQEHDRVAAHLGDPDFERKIGGHIERATFSGPWGPETERPGIFPRRFRSGLEQDWRGPGHRDDGRASHPRTGTSRSTRFPLSTRAAWSRSRSLVENGEDTFKIGRISMALYERAWSLRGMENLLCDMLAGARLCRRAAGENRGVQPAHHRHRAVVPGDRRFLFRRRLGPADARA